MHSVDETCLFFWGRALYRANREVTRGVACERATRVVDCVVLRTELRLAYLHHWQEVLYPRAEYVFVADVQHTLLSKVSQKAVCELYPHVVWTARKPSGLWNTRALLVSISFLGCVLL